MKTGFLARYFVAVGAKTLSAVETDPTQSNQHEFNGVSVLKSIFGTERTTCPCTFIYFSDDFSMSSVGEITWYDARENHPTRTEYRLYYTNNDVMGYAMPGDCLFVAMKHNGSLLCIVAKKMSTIAAQISWLFGIEPLNTFSISCDFSRDISTEYPARYILEQIGIETAKKDDRYLDSILEKFGAVFPPTKEFSRFAEKTILDGEIVLDNADSALMQFIEREELLFRTLEKYIVEERIKKGFDDIDEFTRFSLSVINRRKSRAGQSLENHVEEIFKARGVRFSRTPITENRSRPDFIFPGISEYYSDSFPDKNLTMLGTKTTCKDRWRQVLAEADRITIKHLLTIEPAISEFQTDEMKNKLLQLVVPTDIQKTYNSSQQKWLLSVEDFIAIVLNRQH